MGAYTRRLGYQPAKCASCTAKRYANPVNERIWQQLQDLKPSQKFKGKEPYYFLTLLPNDSNSN